MSRLTYNNGTADVTASTLYLYKGSVIVRQETGTSSVDVMSQNAVTNELQKLDSRILDIVQQKLNKSEAELVYLKTVDAQKKYAPIDDYALRSELPVLPDFEEFLKKNELPSKVSYFENDAEYLTQTALAGNYYTIEEINKIADQIRADSENWLYNYYDKEQVNDLLNKAKESDAELHNQYEERLSELESINHDEFASKTELESYVKTETFNEKLNDYYNSEEVDNKIAEAIAGENLGSLLTKAEAEATYQPIGEYLTEHQSLEDYYRKDEIDASIANAIEDAIEEQNLNQYLSKAEAETTYQPIGEYLTEHQDISHLMTIERAEEEHEEINTKISGIEEDIDEIDERLSIAERLCANFKIFDNWKPGYYGLNDKACSELIQHDACYHQIIDVTDIRRDEFFMHYPVNSLNNYVREYSGYPSAETYLKETQKTGYDLTIELETKTQYVVVIALLADLPVNAYYVRGIKADPSRNFVTKTEFEDKVTELEEKIKSGNEFDATEIEERLSELELIDHNQYALKSEIPTDYVTESKLEHYVTDEYLNEALESIDVTDQIQDCVRKEELEAKDYATKTEVNTAVENKFNEIIDNAPEQFNTLREIAEYIEQHEEASKALQEAIGNKANRSELNGLATETYVDEKFDSIEEYDDTELKNRIGVLEAINHEEFATKDELDQYAKKSEIPTDYVSESDLEKYALKTDIPEQFDDTELKNRISELESKPFDSYALKAEIPTDYVKNEQLEQYATKEYVGDEIKKIEIPEQYNDTELKNRISVLEAIDHEEFVKNSDIEELNSLVSHEVIANEWTEGRLVVNANTGYITKATNAYNQIIDVTDWTREIYFPIWKNLSSYMTFSEYSEYPNIGDNNGTYIKQSTLSSTTENNFVLDDKTKYIVICSYYNTDEFYVKGVVLGEIAINDKRLAVIEEQYLTKDSLENTLASNINPIQSKVDEIEYELSIHRGKEVTYTDWQENTYYVQSATQSLLSGNGFHQIIEVEEKSTVKVHIAINSELGWATLYNKIFFFSDYPVYETYMSMINLGNNTDMSVTVPAGAKYILVNTGENSSDYYVTVTDTTTKLGAVYNYIDEKAVVGDIPDNVVTEDKLEQYATKEYVNEQLTGIDELLSEILGE